MKAEAGRALRHLDLSAFVVDLPEGGAPVDISSDDAPAALAQAAAVVEAVEAGARLLLLDEDGAAPGFLVRDARMQRLVPRPPTTLLTLLERARDLYEKLGVSIVLATAGAGDYLEVAHTVLRVQDFAVEDVTEEARTIARATATMRVAEPIPELRTPARREGVAPAAGLRAGLAGARGAGARSLPSSLARALAVRPPHPQRTPAHERSVDIDGTWAGEVFLHAVQRCLLRLRHHLRERGSRAQPGHHLPETMGDGPHFRGLAHPLEGGEVEDFGTHHSSYPACDPYL